MTMLLLFSCVRLCSRECQLILLVETKTYTNEQTISDIMTRVNTGLMNGYPCFVIAIAMIGVCTAVIGDVASHLGCFIFLKDTVNAIAFVALGTSVPGL